jgi:hypothetical protein
MTETIVTTDALFEQIHKKYQSTLTNVIRGILNRKRRYMDASFDENDLYSELLQLILKEPERYLTPGKTPLINRLCGLARKHTLIRITKIKRRHDIIEPRPHELAGKYCEAFTPLEMESIRWEQEQEDE